MDTTRKLDPIPWGLQRSEIMQLNSEFIQNFQCVIIHKCTSILILNADLANILMLFAKTLSIYIISLIYLRITQREAQL